LIEVARASGVELKPENVAVDDGLSTGNAHVVRQPR
jgi:hypothetical protein